MAIPPGNHTDWPWPFSLIPRKATAIASDKPPQKLAGNCPDDAHFDIPPRGTWVVTDFEGNGEASFWASTSEDGWHWRIGKRYDYIDHYYQLISFTIKKLD